MKSMTGYGRALLTCQDYQLTVEIKTVNNRFLDINFKYPKGFIAFEEIMRNAIKSKIIRGRVDVFINFTDNRVNNDAAMANTALAKAYINAAAQVSQATNLDIASITLSDVLRFPEVIKQSDDGDKSFLQEHIIETLNKAIDALIDMREREGQKLYADVLEKLLEIEQTVAKLKEFAPKVSQNYLEKLTKRVNEALQGAAIDESRILNEVAVYADRSSIDEELTRLTSHIAQFKKIATERECGKKLDFLVQEFNREANTVCSKSNDISITDCGLKLKSDIEKIREQIQNIE